MSDYVVNVSLPGYNVITDKDPNHFALHCSEDNVLIKEFARGSVTLTPGQYTYEITHGLGYVPMFSCYVFHDNYGGPWVFMGVNWWIDDQKIYIRINDLGTTNYKVHYFIFYDNIV